MATIPEITPTDAAAAALDALEQHVELTYGAELVAREPGRLVFVRGEQRVTVTVETGDA